MDMNKRRWEPVLKLWNLNLPTSFIIKISGHSSTDSFRKHTKRIRNSWGDDWFKPRKKGFKPTYDLKFLLEEK